MKQRSKKYLKQLKKEAVEYYFQNSKNNSLKHISDKFNINEDMLSSSISKEIKKRFNNSFSRRMASL